MRFQKVKSDFSCVGGRHRSATVKIYGDITSKVLIDFCTICNRENSMTVSDNTIQAESLGSFFKGLGKISAKASEKLATNVLKNPGIALEIGTNVAIAAASRNPKNVLSTLPEVINFTEKDEAFTSEILYKSYYINGSKNKQIVSICTIRKYLFRTKARKQNI